MDTGIHELASLALEFLPQAVLITDQAGEILVRNASAKALLRGGGHVSSVLDSPDGKMAIDWQAELAALEEEPTGLTNRGVTLAGRGDRRLLADIHVRRLAAQGAAVGAVLIVVEDVSGRASMERRLAASERLTAAGSVAARVAHELNNPLDGVLRYIGLAQRVAGEAAGEYLASARAGLTRMAEIVRSLLEQGGLRRQGRQKASAEHLLDEALAAFAPRAQALGVAVVCDLADGSAVLTDGSVFQVFCNIIKNALDAMPNGGVLSIRMRRREDRCVIELADNGCGMTQQEAQRAFEPFYTTKPTGEGTGLGLSICREILTQLGGTITASPRKEGGVVVTVALPVREASAPGAAVRAHAPGERPPSRIRSHLRGREMT
jgi:signal transduction histidine kinase